MKFYNFYTCMSPFGLLQKIVFKEFLAKTIDRTWLLNSMSLSGVMIYPA